MLGALAAAVAPHAALAEPQPPSVFAEFGPHPPDIQALEAAIAHGADFLTTPIVGSKDGALVIAPDNELSVFTDVASRPEFLDRRAQRIVDGATVAGWFSESFTLAELQTLLTGPPPRDARSAPPRLITLQAAIDTARAGCVREARVIGVSPRLVHPLYFRAQELALEPRLADLVRVNGFNARAAAMIVQSSEPAALRRFGELSRARRMQLIDAGGGPADAAAPRFAAMISADGLINVRSWAEAIAPAESLLIRPGDHGAILATGLASAAHAAGLRIVARAAPASAGHEWASPKKRLLALFLAGADGVMARDIGQAARARSQAMDQLRRPQ